MLVLVPEEEEKKQEEPVAEVPVAQPLPEVIVAPE